MENKKRLVFAADHAGYTLKNALIAVFKGRGYDIIDVGTNSPESCDYPLFAEKACKIVTAGDADLAILCCGTGIRRAQDVLQKVHLYLQSAVSSLLKMLSSAMKYGL